MADNNNDKTVIVVQTPPSQVLGILSIVFSIIGIFAFAIIFAPLGLIFGIISIVKKQVGLGIAGIILSLVAMAMSPTFWAMFGGAAIVATH